MCDTWQRPPVWLCSHEKVVQHQNPRRLMLLVWAVASQGHSVKSDWKLAGCYLSEISIAIKKITTWRTATAQLHPQTTHFQRLAQHNKCSLVTHTSSWRSSDTGVFRSSFMVRDTVTERLAWLVITFRTRINPLLHLCAFNDRWTKTGV